MARHHYVPQFILRPFVADSAWTLVEPAYREKTREQDERLTNGPAGPKSPVCLLSKARPGVGGRLHRSTVRNTCSVSGFYGLKHYDDPVLRGVLRHHIEFIAGNRPKELSIAGYRELGRDPIDTELIESKFIGKLDSHLARSARHIMSGDELNRSEWDIIRRCLTFARTRTPAWRDGFFPEITASIVESAKPTARFSVGSGYVIEDLTRVFHENMWIVHAVGAASGHMPGPLTTHGVRIAVMRAPSGASFVAGDNPMRPYLLDELPTLLVDGVPGYGNEQTVATYTISPTHCLLTTRNRAVRDGDVFSIDENQVRRINTAHLLSAYREVVLPGPTIDGLFESWVDALAIPPPRRL